VLGVAVRGVGAGEHVGLLRARRHAGRRAAALDVDQHRRDLGEVGETDELGHQRDAGAGGGGERARAVPAGADDHADRCQLVLGLDNAVALLATDRVGTQLLGIALEGFGDRRGGGDRVPGADRRATVDAAERGGTVAVGEDHVADTVAALDLEGDRLQVLAGVVAAEVECLQVGVEKLLLALVLFAEELLDFLWVDVEQRRQGADVDDVLEQLPFARVAVGIVADLGQRHAEDVDVAAQARARYGFRAVVEEVAAGIDLATSCSQLCGFIATIRSTPPRRPR